MGFFDKGYAAVSFRPQEKVCGATGLNTWLNIPIASGSAMSFGIGFSVPYVR